MKRIKIGTKEILKGEGLIGFEGNGRGKDTKHIGDDRGNEKNPQSERKKDEPLE
jgi:hypothetical protein